MLSITKTLVQHFQSSNFSRRLLHKYIFNMDKAYLRQLEDTGQFEITFQYSKPEQKIDRKFNLCRKSTETVSSFLTRVCANIEKEVRKKNKKAQTALPQFKAFLSVEDEQVDGNAICQDVFIQSDKNIVLDVNSNQYKVIVNSPWVNTLDLPTSIMAGFVTYPLKFEAVHTDKSLSKFEWYKSANKKDWIQVGESFMYTPSNEDIDCYLKLKCIPRNDKLEGPTTECESTVKVEAGPGPCPFHLRHKFTQNKCTGDYFRVVSYNILADLYCDMDYTRQVLHPYCPEYALAIGYRKQLFVKEILGYNADIICLQEVDKKVYNHDLQMVFGSLGYDGDFCIKGGVVAEGLACFFDSKRFEKIQSHRLVLSEEINKSPLFADIWTKIETNKDLSDRILDRSNVLQINVLKSLENLNEILVVANTHLYFHPDADHIRLLQGGFIIKYLEKFLKDLGHEFANQRVSLIFCGDFNSTPECGIYQLYTTGQVAEDHVDFHSNAEQAVKGVRLEQSLKLQSACGTPPFTNFTAGFAACLDYIFYEQNKLDVVQVVPLPSLEELNQHTALPSIVFPSDHISLISDLKWT